MSRSPVRSPEHTAAEASMDDVEEERPGESSEYKLRKQLLLLATLVVGVTYVAGLNPPGGVRQEDGGPGVKAGQPILRATHHIRYLCFYYCNATALAASLVVVFLLLLKDPNRVQLAVLRLVMVLDLLGLMGAYLAGSSCRERPATVYSAALVLAISAYVGVHVLQALSPPPHPQAQQQLPQQQAAAHGHHHHSADRAPASVLRPRERRKVLLLLATFTAAITYVAGLNPPGGFWDTSSGDGKGPHRFRLGDSLVEAYHRGHFNMFFYCNTTAFVMSLFTVVLLLDRKLSTTARSFALLVFVLGALLGLMAAYAAGSCRDTNCTVYVVSLFGVVLAFVFLAMVVILWRLRDNVSNDTRAEATNGRVGDGESSTPASNGQAAGRLHIAQQQGTNAANKMHKATKKVKSLVLLLANLAATVTYQAGLDPPGGFWPDNRDGHQAGDSILMTKQPMRYKAFFYCNSIAFVVSLVAILMVQNVKLVKSHTLLVAMMLDMFALIGAYAAGSCRDLATSVQVVAMAGAVLSCVVIHVMFFTLRSDDPDAGTVEKQHKRLLMLAILVATITYQVGLAPPAGFRIEDGDLRRRAGDAVLLYSYPRRYKAFFYCNTASFMASIALILLLVNPNLSRLSIRCYALYACQVAGLLGLMGAYAAGSAQSVRTSIYVFVLVATVIAFMVLNIIAIDFWKRRKTTGPAAPAAPGEDEPAVGRSDEETEYRDEVYARRKYLMLLGILAASVTYQAGMAPPGGLWQDDGVGGRQAGNPVLHDTDPRRYGVFFYSNSTSFVASVVVIGLLLQQILRAHIQGNHKLLLLATNTAVVLDLLGLLAAYTAGSTRQWKNVVVLPLLVVLFMAVHAAIWLFREKRRCRCGGGQQQSNGGPELRQMEEQTVNGHVESFSSQEV